MRRFTMLAICLLAAASFAASTAWAQNAHFIHTATVAGVFSDGSISVSFKEAGVGDNQNINYLFSGSFVADYGCVNKGGNHPQASNKETVAGPINVPATFNSGKNGTISQTITFTPPDANSLLKCPGGQVAVLADIAYSGLSLEDTTNSVSATLDSTSLSRTFFSF
jgi:hypothetical protein